MPLETRPVVAPMLVLAKGLRHALLFAVANPTMLQAVKVGDKVEFEADRVNGRITVTRIEKTK
jgi:hypothetical protein